MRNYWSLVVFTLLIQASVGAVWCSQVAVFLLPGSIINPVIQYQIIIAFSFTIFGLILALAGFVGCILPILPGPPLGFIALLVLSLAKDWEPFGVTFFVIM